MENSADNTFQTNGSKLSEQSFSRRVLTDRYSPTVPAAIGTVQPCASTSKPQPLVGRFQWKSLRALPFVSGKQRNSKQHVQKRRCLLVVPIIVVLYLLASSTFSLVRVLSFASSSLFPPNGTSGGILTMDIDYQECILQYQIDAPSSPSSYPCSTCLAILSTKPLAALSVLDQQLAYNAIQFCALKSLFENANTLGQQALQGVNWVQNLEFCVWGGVTCDGNGRIDTMYDTYLFSIFARSSLTISFWE